MHLNIEVTPGTEKLLWCYLLVWRGKKKEDRSPKLEHLDYLSKILCNECVPNCDNNVTVVKLWYYDCQKLFLQPVTIMPKALTNMVKECVGVKCIKCILRGADLWAFSEWYFQERRCCFCKKVLRYLKKITVLILAIKHKPMTSRNHFSVTGETRT